MMNVSQGPLEFSEAPEGECDGRGEGGSPGQGDGRHQQGQQDRGARQTRPVQPQGQLTGQGLMSVMSCHMSEINICSKMKTKTF